MTEVVLPAELEPQMEVPLDAEPASSSLHSPMLQSHGLHSFLTAEESSVFAEERPPREPRIFGESNVFAEEDPIAEDLNEEESAEEEPTEEDGSAGPVA